MNMSECKSPGVPVCHFTGASARWGGVVALVLCWRMWRCFTCSALVRVALLRSAPVQGVSRPPHTASRDCRNGSPLARAIPCVPAPEYGSPQEKEKRANDATRCKSHPAFLPPIPHAAQRAVPGWRGGLGRVGADLASAGSMRPPPSPARHGSPARLATTQARQETERHVSTAWLATTHASREASNHQRQARNGLPRVHTHPESEQNAYPLSSRSTRRAPDAPGGCTGRPAPRRA